MSDINIGHTWSEGEVVTAGGLNNAVNNAVIQPEFLSAKPDGSPHTTDKILFHEAATDTLKTTTIDTLNSLAVPVVLPNYFLAGPATGFATFPSYRAMKPKDLVVPPVGISSTTVDWSLGTTFFLSLAGTGSITAFTNAAEGQEIQILIFPQGHTLSWPAGIKWQGGSAPTLTVTAGRWDLITLYNFQSTFFGDFKLNYG